MLPELKSLLQTEIDPAFHLRAKYILSKINKIKPQKVLDAGCGRGFYLNALTYYKFIKEIHGVDINPKYLNSAKKNCFDKRVIIKKSSLYSLPYPNDYFDMIICSEVLEHLKDDIRALLELKRILKKNGEIVITVPYYDFPFFWDPINWLLMKLFNRHINKNIWWLAGIWADHEKLYTDRQIRNLAIKAGLKNIRVKKSLRFCWPFSHFILYGVGKNLVEKGYFNSLNRFNFSKENYLSLFLAKLFALPSRLLDNKIKSSHALNLLISVKKS